MPNFGIVAGMKYLLSWNSSPGSGSLALPRIRLVRRPPDGVTAQFRSLTTIGGEGSFGMFVIANRDLDCNFRVVGLIDLHVHRDE